MGQPMVHGTRHFSGLNTQVSKHLLGDSELTVADNVNFDEIGAVKSEYDDLQLAGTLMPDGGGFVDIDGVAHYVYKDFVTGSPYLRDYTGGSVSTIHTGTWNNSSRLRATQGNAEAILTDGGAPYVYDGDFVRKLGPLRGTGYFEDYYNAPLPVVRTQEAATKTINDISVAGDGTVTVTTTTSHGLSDGDRIYIDSVVGATEANGRTYTVSQVDADEFTLDDTDGSDWTAYGSAGTVYINGSGLIGEYKYRYSHTMTLPSGKIVESSPLPILTEDGAESITVAATDVVEVICPGFFAADIAGWIPDTTYVAAHLGVDLLCGVKVWRTAAGGESYSVVSTGAHADVYLAADSIYRIYDTTSDAARGAAWLQAYYDDYDPPPNCELFTIANGFAYAMDADDPGKIQVSLFNDYEHWRPADNTIFPGVTALAPAGDYVTVWAQTRLWYWAFVKDGLGTVKEIPVQLGVAGPEAVVSTSGPVAFSNDLGFGVLYFANDLGLWRTDPSGAVRISDHLRADWIAAGGGTWAGAILGDKMIWACDTGAADSAFVIKATPEGMIWGRTAQQASQDYELFFADPINNKIIAQVADGLYEFGGDTDSEKTMTATSKWYGGMMSNLDPTAWLDVSSGASGTFNVYTNLSTGVVATGTVSNTGSQRKLVRVDLANVPGEYWWVSYTGTGTLYGYSFKTTPTNNVR